MSTYVTTSLQLARAHPEAGASLGSAFVRFPGVFRVTPLPIAVLEGALTVLVIRAPTTPAPGTRQTITPTVVALLALALAACAGVWSGPGKAVGRVDKVRQIVEATFTPAVSPWREQLALPSPSAERLQYSLLSRTTLLVLVLTLVSPAYAKSRRRSARGTGSADRDALATDER